MSPWYLLLAPAGVGFLVLVTWLAGGFRTAQLPHLDAALRRLREDEPDFMPFDSVLGADGHGAAFLNAAGEVAIVYAVGIDLNARVLRPGSVARVDLAPATPDGARRLTVRLRDVTAPEFQLTVPADADAEQWRGRFVALMQSRQEVVAA